MHNLDLIINKYPREPSYLKKGAGKLYSSKLVTPQEIKAGLRNFFRLKETEEIKLMPNPRLDPLREGGML